jgi:hypothetical protein
MLGLSGDDLLDDSPHDALFEPRVGGRGGPDGLQIACQGGEGGWRFLHARGCRRVVGGDLRLDVIFVNLPVKDHAR